MLCRRRPGGGRCFRHIFEFEIEAARLAVATDLLPSLGTIGVLLKRLVSAAEIGKFRNLFSAGIPNVKTLCSKRGKTSLAVFYGYDNGGLSRPNHDDTITSL